MHTISLEGIDPLDAMCAVYGACSPWGLGFLHYDSSPLARAEAAALLKEGFIDYHKGRRVKAWFTPETNTLTVGSLPQEDVEAIASALREPSANLPLALHSIHIREMERAVGQAKGSDGPFSPALIELMDRTLAAARGAAPAPPVKAYVMARVYDGWEPEVVEIHEVYATNLSDAYAQLRGLVDVPDFFSTPDLAGSPYIQGLEASRKEWNWLVENYYPISPAE